MRLTGAFKANFTTLGNSLVIPTAKRDHISTTAKVLDIALVSSSPDKVVTLVFINQSTKGATLTTPRVTGARLRVTVTRVAGHWLISALEPI